MLRSIFRSLPAAALLVFLTFPVRGEEVQGLVMPIKQVSVASPVLQEIVEAVLVEEGDTVTAGQTLVQLRRNKEQLQVDEAHKLIENAEFVAKGAEALLQDKMGSREQALKTKTDLELAKIRLEVAEVQLKEKTIKAPLAGIVVRKYKEPGESVDRVEKLVDIVNIDQVYVVFYLDPKLSQGLLLKQPVSVHFPVLNNEGIKGEIEFIDPRFDASSGLCRVKVLINNPDHRIKAGMRGVAEFSKKI